MGSAAVILESGLARAPAFLTASSTQDKRFLILFTAIITRKIELFSYAAAYLFLAQITKTVQISALLLNEASQTGSL